MLPDKLVFNEQGVYLTKKRPIGLFSRLFPSLCFYLRFIKTIYTASRVAKKGQYPSERWSADSLAVLRALESVGVEIEISGQEHFIKNKETFVFIGNHMSTLETMVLPCIIQPKLDVTFIVKQALLDYPIFKHIMRSRSPIALTRNDPRKDFKIVMSDGVKKLQNNISMIVFPQTTRTNRFNPEAFSSIGVKLAKKANKRIIPVALITDAWGNGKIIKDFGKIYPAKKVIFKFGEPVSVDGGKSQESIIDFIATNVNI